MKQFIFLITLNVLISINRDARSERPPNIVLIFCDDLGFADLSCYGSVWNQTPGIDRMAVEGLRFTDFYAGAPVCTPSRAGLLTGCYPRRVDMDLDAQGRWVLFPVAEKGINPDEVLLPEALKKAGYHSAIIGKWHLGDQPGFLPVEHGFDYWFGLPYSNDMENKKRGDPPLPLMRNKQIIRQENTHREFDQSTLTMLYTREAIGWIDDHRDQPFFLCLAHTMPHNPVAARPGFYERTCNPKERFGASVAEISWSTGAILDYLKTENLDRNTLVIFTSDNGGNPHWGASNGILRGHKGQTWEGGMRVPCIAWFPGRIEPGTTCNAHASVIDFFPTFLSLAGIEADNKIKRDGKDISGYFFNPGDQPEPRAFFYWHVGYLEAVRYGDWKLHLAGKFSRKEQKEPELYNLRNDPGETTDLAAENPDVVEKLNSMAEKQKQALGTSTDKGPEVRQTIRVENPVPLVKHP